ncbi:MAG: ArsR/SmtB family transcription factor [Allosphingosinicella sp.]
MDTDSNAVFAAISDPTRREILRTLQSSPRDVGTLAARFPISRPAVSKHLAALHRAGLVSCTTIGRSNVYEVKPEPLEAVRAWLDGFWNERLRLLKRVAEGDS